MSAMGHIDATEQQANELITAAQANDNPIVMVNLLKFNDGPGRASYLRYATEVQPFLDKVGASIVYVGDVHHNVIGAPGEPWWDTILLVSYPSRARFLEMVLDPDYQAISAHRSNALANSGLIATEMWDAQY